MSRGVNVRMISVSTSLRTIRSTHGVAYQAQLRIKHLRIQTRIMRDLGKTCLYQKVLAQVGDAIASADNAIWDAPDKFCQTVQGVFQLWLARGYLGSADELGLTVHVYMRADGLIDRRRAITSPCMPLRDAVSLHARLVLAQRSWESLKAEWVPLLQQTCRARMRGLSAQDADGIATAARLGLLERKLARAVRSVETALGREKRSSKLRQGRVAQREAAPALRLLAAACS